MINKVNDKISLSSGITEFLIVSFLERRDSYAYEIAQYIRKFSDNKIDISQNTVYTVVYKLEERGMIGEYKKLVGKKRTRVYYRLEPEAAPYIAEMKKQYFNMMAGIGMIQNAISTGEFDNIEESIPYATADKAVPETDSSLDAGLWFPGTGIPEEITV